MKKKLLFIFLLTALPLISLAQVDDISFILSPKAEYNWFDDNSTVEDGLLYGLDAGFGFGDVFELRGIFRQSVDLSQTFGAYQDEISDLLDEGDFSFDSRNIRVRRFGGEIKANILTGKFSPYLTLGTGVQKFEQDLPDEETLNYESIYTSLGLGVKLNVTDRVTFDIVGNTVIYNLDPESFLFDPDAPSEVDDVIGTLGSQRMYNWAVSAGLSFYLGGINQEELSPLENAYLQRYSGELYGTKFTLAPAGSYVNFDNESDFRDTYMLGGILGVDFSDYFGLQAYYFQNNESEGLSFDFGNLAKFGLDFVGRLNIPRGIVPYITVGGGYLNASDEYQGRFSDDTQPPEEQEVDSKFYAKGGAGLEIPLSTNLSIFGSANLLYTVGDETTDIEDLSSVDQLRQHSKFTAGIRYRFGKQADTRKATERAFENRLQQIRNEENRQEIENLKEELNKAFEENDIARMEEILSEIIELQNKDQDITKENQEKQSFSKRSKSKMDSLQVELLTAYENNNMKKIKQIMIEKGEIEARNDSLSRSENAKGLVRMTPEELQSLINKTINQVVQESDTTTIKNRLDRIERLILNLGGNVNGRSNPALQGEPDQQKDTQLKSGEVVETPESNASERELSNNIEELNERLQSQIARIDQLMEALRTQEQQVTIPESDAPVIRTPGAPRRNVVTYDSGLLNDGFSAFTSYSFGDVNSVNLGLRRYYGLRNTSFVFIPEAYIAVAENYGLGVSANGVFPFDIQSNPRLKPYAGLGLGFNFVDGDFSLNPNFIIGTFYNLGNSGRVFFDYTVRGGFNYNQVAIGYRFSL